MNLRWIFRCVPEKGLTTWRHEADWPVPETKYVRFYLDNSRGQSQLVTQAPENAGKAVYNA